MLPHVFRDTLTGRICELCAITRAGMISEPFYVIVSFSTGRSWEFPGILRHHIEAHAAHFRIPAHFVRDVMLGMVVNVPGRPTMKSPTRAHRFGICSYRVSRFSYPRDEAVLLPKELHAPFLVKYDEVVRLAGRILLSPADLEIPDDHELPPGAVPVS